MKRLFLFLALSCSLAKAQSQFDLSRDVKGKLPIARISPGVAGQCLTTDGGGNTAWSSCAGGGGSGTVTNFSAGTLSPLFSTSVANPTTTPALSFILSNFAAHGFLGNNTGSSAAPAVVVPRSIDLADVNPTAPSTSGKILIWDQPSGTYIPGDPLVQGLVADGSTTAENPVAIGGYDTAGTPALHRATFINGTPGGTEYGIITRNIPSGTQTISGTVTANIGTTNGLALDATLTGGTTKAINRGGAKGSTAAADVSSTASGANHQGLDVALYDASGNQLGLSASPVRTDPTGTTPQPVSGTITANIGTSGSLALDASVTGLQVSQGSTTSGQKGELIQCAITTGAPTYTTAQTDPLSCDTSGNLRANVTNTVTVSGTVTTNPPSNASTSIAQINGVTPLMGNGVAGTGSLRVTVASDNTAFSVNNTQQGTASQNVTQFGGTNISTGTGAGGTGIPRVTVSNDSSMVGTLADNGAAAAANRFATLPTIYQTSYLNGTAATQGRNGALSQGTDGLLWTANLPAIRPASFAASAAVTSAASATDIAVMPGNASNTVLLTRIRVSCTQTTAGIITLNIIKRTTADTAGTSAGMTAIADDSNTSAAVSAPLTYTANPTINNTTGNVDTLKFGCMATGTTSPNDIYILNRQQKPLVLRGTAQQIAINLGGVTVTGGSFTVTFEWIETSTITP